ncbi:MAG: endonuclease MutS2 [candidate division NC10 bacterium]|nr:endonuclease MutS2 [candidate division NC10 bacterium]
MDAHSLELLEFPAVREILAEEAASPYGVRAALDLHPLTSFEAAEAALEETGEARLLLAQEDLSFQGVFDLRSHLKRARLEGSFLTPQELLEVASTLSACLRLKTAIQRLSPAYPRLQQKARRVVALDALVEGIHSAIAEGGYVVDTATEPLRSLRGEILRLREKIQARLQALLAAPSSQPAIAEPLITLRNDRYVIPVKSGYRAFLKGVVQDASQSGQTLFLEPEGVVELNNQLVRVRRMEEEEVKRILLRLTAKVRQHLQEIEETLAALAEVDLTLAKARLADRWRASRPKLVREGKLLLLKARHPLLLEHQRRGLGFRVWGLESGIKKGEEAINPMPYTLDPGISEVVPIDVWVGEGFRALIITGPNTGGKTVALKTVGLLSVMALSGLHIPASPDSQIPFFRGLYADIGDEQSIEQSLSTFSSHLSQLLRMLEAADEGSLLLLDELGAGTDPAEGAALGIALLESLLAKGALVLGATHLDAIKAYAFTHPEMENACTEFDLDSLRPLYKLSIGFTGRSYAIEVAERLGLPVPLVQRARELLGKREEGVPVLLDRLRQEQDRLKVERDALKRVQEEAARHKARYLELLAELQAKESHLHREAKRQLQELVASARREVERLVAELRRQKGSREAIKEVRESLEVLEAVNLPSFLVKEMEEVQAPPVETPSPGQRVWIRHLKQEGIVVGPGPRGMVEVQLPLGRVKVPLETLSSVKERPQTSSFTPSFLIRPEEVTLSPELSLLGMTTEEAVKVAERYLDDAFLVGLKRVKIIHGKGTGALRRAVEELLKLHPLVEGFRLADFNDGGVGATVVELQSRGG